MPVYYATKASSLLLRHANGAQMTSSGVEWPRDSETMRLLTSGEITADPAAAWPPRDQAALRALGVAGTQW